MIMSPTHIMKAPRGFELVLDLLQEGCANLFDSLNKQ